jgi:hypothetical protein
MSKVKTTKDNTLKLKDTKTQNHEEAKQIFDEFINLHTWETTIVTRELARKFGDNFLVWAMYDGPGKKAYVVCDWYIKMGMSRDDFYRLLNTFPEFKAKYELGKQVIGSRRIQGAMGCEDFKPLNEKIVSYSQYQYDPDWKEADAYHDERKRKLAEEERKTGGKFTIEMMPCKDCPEVPPCKEEE